jgi:hypothetical protein
MMMHVHMHVHLRHTGVEMSYRGQRRRADNPGRHRTETGERAVSWIWGREWDYFWTGLGLAGGVLVVLGLILSKRGR